MASYLPLKKVKYATPAHPRMTTDQIDAEYRRRLQWPSTIITSLFPALDNKESLATGGYMQKHLETTKFPLFFVETTQINFAVNQVVRRSDQIKALVSSPDLPGVAIESYVNSLLQNEIVFTNDIEGVQTDPEEIGTIIGEMQQKQPIKRRRLESTIRKYRDSLRGNMQQITKVDDFRALYDDLLKGEITKSQQPDGVLFRNRFVQIGQSDKTVHIPPDNEDEIMAALNQLITFMNDDSYIPLEKALITHFFFENTHPFLDGNGRTGRYLLSSYLSNKLDSFTGLSLSTAIHAHVQTYYRLFQEADDVENRAELTFFLAGMLEIIQSGQDEVIMELTNRQAQLQKNRVQIDQQTPQLDKEQHEILYLLLQSKLFTQSTTLGIQDRNIIELMHERGVARQRTRANLSKLTAQGFLTLINKKPLQHILANDWFATLK
ncbi:Fic family protein [Schleiferilactobacillus perolens]|jgi:Fic family protein|uniref:Fic family protein n=1 Tax=Schleiferilactobacillus perolens TaxID=100468 RepID=UPI002355659F|nr:Fic family protein [Schleiferilactobacillus perolens]MCI2171361.1 Fic family protein [Schleiferilactobacillus perolens]